MLARRTRALFLNAKAAIAIAQKIGTIMARELQMGEAWQREQVQSFISVAAKYLIQKS